MKSSMPRDTAAALTPRAVYPFPLEFPGFIGLIKVFETVGRYLFPGGGKERLVTKVVKRDGRSPNVISRRLVAGSPENSAGRSLSQ